MNTREEFEEWVGNTSWTPYQKSIMFLAWQEQQKKIDDLQLKLAIKNDMITALNLTIDELKSLNPDVPCPMCGGEGTLPLDCSSEYDENFCDCGYCKSSGTVPLTKAQEYRIEQLEATINRMIEEAR